MATEPGGWAIEENPSELAPTFVKLPGVSPRAAARVGGVGYPVCGAGRTRGGMRGGTPGDTLEHMFDTVDREPPPWLPPDPDGTAAALAGLAPGGDTVAALALLGPAVLSQAGRIDALTAVDRALA
jgi:hypothetical protein